MPAPVSTVSLEEELDEALLSEEELDVRGVEDVLALELVVVDCPVLELALLVGPTELSRSCVLCSPKSSAKSRFTDKQPGSPSA